MITNKLLESQGRKKLDEKQCSATVRESYFSDLLEQDALSDENILQLKDFFLKKNDRDPDKLKFANYILQHHFNILDQQTLVTFAQIISVEEQLVCLSHCLQYNLVSSFQALIEVNLDLLFARVYQPSGNITTPFLWISQKNQVEMLKHLLQFIAEKQLQILLPDLLFERDGEEHSFFEYAAALGHEKIITTIEPYCVMFTAEERFNLLNLKNPFFNANALAVAVWKNKPEAVKAILGFCPPEYHADLIYCKDIRYNQTQVINIWQLGLIFRSTAALRELLHFVKQDPYNLGLENELNQYLLDDNGENSKLYRSDAMIQLKRKSKNAHQFLRL